ncbi:hypothetical protein FIBSPDRAFT_931320 [Athelia psychrophila]|uniref:Uncharacterized protein n=1 Tax=Athelia psychrophila TaxID=1759441 RepID=A0A166KNX3_9AGAM|nr:hypothetical protein FIBSPDRAFT_931320 [Fibularhizoctonia sp. CBS 109695]
MSIRPIVSQILNVSVRPGFELESPKFTQLRKDAFSRGAWKQSFGTFSGEPDQLCWLIHWPEGVATKEVRDSLLASAENLLDVRLPTKSWSVPFKNFNLIQRALNAPLCQLCTIQLKDVKDTEKLQPSLHKTYSDCYDAPDGGFTGGYWGPASNEPETNWYFLGWESRKLHDDYAATELFDIEIDRLTPFMKNGWAHYVKFTHEDSD